MNSIRTVFYSLVLILSVSCATPTSPTGGPRDEEGPDINSTEPETGTTNFSGRNITFHFSEFINRGSVTEAISVEPDIGIPYVLDWGRKSLTVHFEDDLPDSTTLIVTLGTDLKDMNGNKLATPSQVAVSTGPEIDKGKITGKILDAQTGKGGEGNRILLYRKPVDLTKRAIYSAETDTGGTFQFSYLRPGDYKAFWVDDRNRNRIWDRSQERAQPFRKEFVSLKKAGADTLKTLYLAQPDTSDPVFQGVGLFSDQRLRLRFSEGIKLLDSTRIEVRDSTGSEYSEAYPLYVSPAESYVLFAHSEKPLSPADSFEVILRNVSDQFGNVRLEASLKTTGSAQSDTTRQRIIKRENEAGLFPGEPLEIVYAKPITGREVRDSLKVVAGSKMVENPARLAQVKRNKLSVIPPNGWEDGVAYEVRVWEPYLQQARKIAPEVWSRSDLGDLFIQLEDTASTEKHQLVLKSEERGIMADTSFTKEITLTSLPPLNYQAILYKDLNENGIWDHGQVEPFRAPEPYVVRNNIPVKGNFTSDLMMSFYNQQFGTTGPDQLSQY